MNKLVLAFLGIAAFGWSSAAHAQCVVGSPDYDQCFFQQLNQMQQQNNAAIQQNYYNYLQAYGPMLQQAYNEWGYTSGATFDQFAYYMLLSANGTNPQAALEAQRRQFAGNQAAYQTQQQTGQTYIDTMQQNSNRNLNAIEGYSTGAIRGNVIVNGPDGPVELPYSGMQVGQRVEYNGWVYEMTDQGYAVWNGSYWQLLGY